MEFRLPNGRSLEVALWLDESERRFYLQSPYDPVLVQELKSFEKRKWDQEKRIWSFANTARNRFIFSVLLDKPVYDQYLSPLIPIETSRELVKKDPRWENQSTKMIPHLIQRKRCILAAWMRAGKTLCVIEALEKINPESVWWVGPVKTLPSVKNMFASFEARVVPRFITYDTMRISVIPERDELPQVIIFDEASRLKNYKSARTKVAKRISEEMELVWGEDAYVWLLSGYPAPLDPVDWWSQCEIARPGWLFEPTPDLFRRRLAVMEYKEVAFSTFAYTHVCWKNGQRLEQDVAINEKGDLLKAGTVLPDEISQLTSKLNGLVLRVDKEDCGIPESVEEVAICKPPEDMLRVAQVIVSSSGSVGKALGSLRQLSDGFQYQESSSGRKTVMGATPKDNKLRELLGEYYEQGRIVIFGGFQGSVDRIIRVCLEEGWKVICCDGRGWRSFGNIEATEKRFQTPCDEQIAFVGHPGSGGQGLTLNSASCCVFYSNDFNPDYREQAKARITGPNLVGRRIVDIICLGTDEYIRNKLNDRRELAETTLDSLKRYLET